MEGADEDLPYPDPRNHTLFDSYVAFVRTQANFVLRTMKNKRARKSYKHSLKHIGDSKRFWDGFDALPEDHCEYLRRVYSAGFSSQGDSPEWPLSAN